MWYLIYVNNFYSANSIGNNYRLVDNPMNMKLASSAYMIKRRIAPCSPLLSEQPTPTSGSNLASDNTAETIQQWPTYLIGFLAFIAISIFLFGSLEKNQRSTMHHD